MLLEFSSYADLYGCYGVIHRFLGVDSPAAPSAADGSEKPAGAKPTGHGVAGLRARRHRYPDALCG